MIQAERALGSLALLDGSHSYVAARTVQYKNKINGDQGRAETEAMCAFLNQFIPIDYNKLSEECNALVSHEAKVEWTVAHLMDTGSFTDKEDLSAAVESFWCKLKMADEYIPSRKMVCPTVRLFKATEGHGEAEGLGKDYGLGEVCQGEVVVHSIVGDHDTFIQGPSAKAIAEILS